VCVCACASLDAAAPVCICVCMQSLCVDAWWFVHACIDVGAAAYACVMLAAEHRSLCACLSAKSHAMRVRKRRHPATCACSLQRMRVTLSGVPVCDVRMVFSVLVCVLSSSTRICEPACACVRGACVGARASACLRVSLCVNACVTARGRAYASVPMCVCVRA
jgi:hypothetical protein